MDIQNLVFSIAPSLKDRSNLFSLECFFFGGVVIRLFLYLIWICLVKIVTIFTSQVFLISSIQKSQLLLPPANVVCEGYDFTPVCDSVNRGGRAWLLPGACMVAPGGWRAWLLPGGACVIALGVCVVALGGGHAWLLRGGMCGCSWGGHVWFFPRGGMRRIRRDTVNERAVRILLECILVLSYVTNSCCLYIAHINISDPEIAPIITDY